MNTLETAVVFTALMLVLSGLIVMPANLCNDTLFEAREAVDDVLQKEDEEISQEGLNTFFTGVSENYRMIYGFIAGEGSSDESE
jgi:hypothetical protein